MEMRGEMFKEFSFRAQLREIELGLTMIRECLGSNGSRE
jgi:hypothetical protein